MQHKTAKSPKSQKSGTSGFGLFYINAMRTLTVSEAKANFGEILPFVQKGERIKISYGKTRKPIAMLVPFEEYTEKRKIGILDGKAKIEFSPDFEMTTEELLELK